MDRYGLWLIEVNRQLIAGHGLTAGCLDWDWRACFEKGMTAAEAIEACIHDAVLADDGSGQSDYFLGRPVQWYAGAL